MHWNIFFVNLALAFSMLSQTIAGTFVQIRLPLGDIELELYDQDKPETVRNFLRYIQSGRFSANQFIHRWEPEFVIQGGGYTVTNRTLSSVEILALTPFANIPNEYSVGRKFSNTYGTIAMARAGGQTNSANSQWFINLGNNSFLDAVDGGFTVFGRVIGSTNVLERFNQVDVTNGVYQMNIGGALNHLPVLSPKPSYEDLVYADITTLKVRVEKINLGTQQISWTSVKSATNVVEFTSTFPPKWNTLIKTNGTGSLLKVQDSSTTSAPRFYRVRVEY
jgi:cyclophilin family peptidyl-prolyl cis-trans isomerase